MGNQPDGTMNIKVSFVSCQLLKSVLLTMVPSLIVLLCLATLVVEQLLLLTTFLMGHRDHNTPIQVSTMLEHREPPISLTTRKEGKFWRISTL